MNITPSEANQELTQVIKKSAGWIVALGILTILLGMFSISSPLFAGVAIQYFVGAALLVGGIFQLIHAFQRDAQQKPLFAFLSGLLAAICGALMFAQPLFGLSLLTLILIGYFVADGLVKIMYAFKHKPESGWGWVLFSGIVTLFLGLMLWRDWPLSGAWAIGVLFGINLIFDGWAMIFTGSAVRSSLTSETNDASSGAS